MFKGTTLLSTYSTEEKGHGREEKRACSMLDTKLFRQEGMYKEWPGLERSDRGMTLNIVPRSYAIIGV